VFCISNPLIPRIRLCVVKPPLEDLYGYPLGKGVTIGNPLGMEVDTPGTLLGHRKGDRPYRAPLMDGNQDSDCGDHRSYLFDRLL
jgi:hypothetical protein